MSDLADLAPVDDAFIRTAIRGLRAPEHHPAFWSELTHELDAAEEQLVAQGLLAPAVPHVAPRSAAPERSPVPELVVPLPATRPDPEPLPEPRPHPPRREPLRARPPAHAAAGAERVPAFGAASAAPRPKLAVRHDPAVLPQSLRSSSNAVLLAIAVAAAVVALVAGLTLVRQRSDASGPPPSEQSPAAAAEVSANPSEGARTPE